MLKKINRYWRIFATGFSFTSFGIGGLILGLVVLPLVTLVVVNPDRQRLWVRRIISSTFNGFLWMMHYLGLLKYRVQGKEVMRQDKSCLVIANHPTLIDVVALIAIYPHACCIVKKELWNNFFVKRVVAGAGYIPNDSPEELLEKSAESLRRGDVLIVFPEGTRSVPGKEMVLQRGAAHIALRLNCPIRTVQIRATPPSLTKNLPWYQVPERRMDFSITVRGMLNPGAYIDQNMPMSLAARRLTTQMRENIEVALGPVL